jgi:hypothetical protein
MVPMGTIRAPHAATAVAQRAPAGVQGRTSPNTHHQGASVQLMFGRAGNADVEIFAEARFWFLIPFSPNAKPLPAPTRPPPRPRLMGGAT